MTELTNSTVHTIAGKEVVFRELSVAGVRKIMTKDASSDALGDGFFETIRLSDLADFTSLTPDDIENMLPSHIRQVIKHCEAQNPDFFAWLARVSSYRAKL